MNRISAQLCEQLKSMIELKNLMKEDLEFSLFSEEEKLGINKLIIFLNEEINVLVKDIIYNEKI